MIDTVDFDEAIDRVAGGLERRSRVINLREKEIVVYHEPGHARIAESCEHADRVAKISVIPRGSERSGRRPVTGSKDERIMDPFYAVVRVIARCSCRRRPITSRRCPTRGRYAAREQGWEGRRAVLYTPLIRPSNEIVRGYPGLRGVVVP